MTTTRQVYRELTDAEKATIQRIKEIGETFLTELNALPNSRELSLAKTKVEEAVMWAVKGLTA